MVDFYRETYRLPFSNGVIFTVESPKKGEQFLLNMVRNHAHNWTYNNQKTPLELGSLESFRNIIHPIDVVNAIEIIMKQKNGDNYIISGDHNYKVKKLVTEIYKLYGIILQDYNNNTFHESSTKLPVIHIKKDKRNGLDKSVVNIQGISTKLKILGWKTSKTMDDILSEFA